MPSGKFKNRGDLATFIAQPFWPLSEAAKETLPCGMDGIQTVYLRGDKKYFIPREQSE